MTVFITTDLAGGAQAQPFPSKTYEPAPVTFQSDAKKQKAGWQKSFVFTFSNGQTGQQIGANCPTKFPVVVSGAFAFNSVGQTDEISLSFNGPRDDETPPSYNAWGWHFAWPNGAMSGESVRLNIYCVAAS
jgi:hypothetical protein